MLGVRAVATVGSSPPPSTPGASVTGKGTLSVGGGTGSFQIKASVRNGRTSGTVTYRDPRISLKGTISAVVVSGSHARLFGAGPLGGTKARFVLDVDDLGTAAQHLDRFQLQLGTGVSAGPATVA